MDGNRQTGDLTTDKIATDSQSLTPECVNDNETTLQQLGGELLTDTTSYRLGESRFDTQARSPAEKSFDRNGHVDNDLG